MKVSKVAIAAGLLAGALALPGLQATAQAHVIGNGASKHNFCYDKHGRWRSHPHCPAPQPAPAHRYYSHRPPYYGHDHHYYASDRYQSRPQVIYVRRDPPYDYRSRYSRPAVNDTVKTATDARREVQQGRDQLRQDRAELKSDRAELRRDIRNHASKEEIKGDRQEIRADLEKMKSTRQEIRSDRRDLAKR
jgi:hypothetical protein